VATFVLVHGGWVGAWFWKGLVGMLRSQGHDVYAPTLTGLGERAHLANPSVDLDTHARDVAAVLEMEDLQNVILAGHSYGGMVITAAAELVADRLSQLIYLDAFVPTNGEALVAHMPAEYIEGFTHLVQTKGDGWRLPLPFPFEVFGNFGEAERQWVESRMRDQPFATSTTPVRLQSPTAAALPRSFVYCTQKPMGLFEISRQRAREAGWRMFEIDAMHAAPATNPDLVARVFNEIAGAGQLQPA
jgi:pimeloyl-ACP methyl ester carboxylesterase